MFICNCSFFENDEHLDDIKILLRREVHTNDRKCIMDKQVKNNQKKVQLISTGMQAFIPFVWIHKKCCGEVHHHHKMLNSPIYLWNIDKVEDYKFSLHFLVYMSNYLMKPPCCSSTNKLYTVGWIGSIMVEKIFHYRSFMKNHNEEAHKIEKNLDEMCCLLNDLITMYSLLDEIPMPETYTSKFNCLTCGIGRRNSCHSCLHHNIILLKIIHRPECWECYSLHIYISKKIRSRPNKYFIFSIDTGKKSVTLGWGEIPIVPLKTRGQKQKYECNQHRSRPLFLDWGLEEKTNSVIIEITFPP